MRCRVPCLGFKYRIPSYQCLTTLPPPLMLNMSLIGNVRYQGAEGCFMLLWREYIVQNFVPVIVTSLMFWASSRRMICFVDFFVVLWSFGPPVLWPGGSPFWGLFTRLTGKSKHLQFFERLRMLLLAAFGASEWLQARKNIYSCKRLLRAMKTSTCSICRS